MAFLGGHHDIEYLGSVALELKYEDRAPDAHQHCRTLRAASISKPFIVVLDAEDAPSTCDQSQSSLAHLRRAGANDASKSLFRRKVLPRSFESKSCSTFWLHFRFMTFTHCRI